MPSQSAACQTSLPRSASAQIDNGGLTRALSVPRPQMVGECPAWPGTPPQPLPTLLPSRGAKHELPQGPPASGTSWGCLGTAMGVPRHEKPPASLQQRAEHAVLHTQALLS